MRVVVDMNLSPDWVALLRRAGFDAQHWSRIANPRALDPEIMEWARQHDAVVLTHDLDFGATLALTHAEGPSVIQMRSEDISPDAAGNSVISALRTYEEELAAGALIVIDETRQRIRLLPLQK
jgi:predicted nuclease of predicted toxin-antitoxin system